MSLYQEKPPWWKKIKPEWIMSGLVAVNAVLLAASAFLNTSYIANLLKIPAWLAIGFIDLQFVTLLIIRKIQEARRYKVSWIVSMTYWFTVAVLGVVSTFGFYTRGGKIGIIAGFVLVISLVAMDNIFAWVLSDKSQIEAKKPLWKRFFDEWKERIEIRVVQYLEWKRYEAGKPSTRLIKKARKTQEKRKKIESEGLPDFFLQKNEPIEQIVVELKETEPVEVKVEPETEEKETAAVVPLKRNDIGFLAEMNNRQPQKAPAPRFQPNEEAREEALEKAETLMKALGRLPKVSEIKEKGVSEYYSKWARSELKKQRETE